MGKNSISVGLRGAEKDDGSPTLGQFLKFCGNVRRCLRIVEGKGIPNQGRARLMVSDLEKGSAVVEIQAMPPKAGADHGPQLIAEFEEIVDRLQNSLPLYRRFTYRELRDFREIAAPLKNGTGRAWIGSVELTSQYTANIDTLLNSRVKSKGKVTGRLERLDVHDANEFSLFPVTSDDEIECTFPSHLWDEVQRGIKKTVTVNGVMTFQPDTPYPDNVRVESLEIHPADDELPTFQSLVGLFGSDSTDGKPAVEFIRAIRDEQG